MYVDRFHMSTHYYIRKSEQRRPLANVVLDSWLVNLLFLGTPQQ